MATAPVLGIIGGVNTVGQLAARIKRDVNEPIGPDRLASIYDYIGDAIESIWMSAMLATLSKFIKGPVNMVFPASQTSVDVITIPDPSSGPSAFPVAGGALFARTIYLSWCIVTESGSTTRLSPLTTLALLANQLARVTSPLVPGGTDIPDGAVGWYLFAGLNPDGSDQGQQTPVPLPFSSSSNWYEPPAGITPAPNSPDPPANNTTGDNVFAINRIDVQNVDTTWTNWIQTNIGGTFWTEFQHKVATTTTWTPFVYDLIDNRKIELRPGPAADLTAAYFYVHRPRRPRFPASRLPFTSFACQAFLYKYCMAMFLQSIYEFEASDRWKKDMEAERMAIVLQIAQGSWNRDNTVRPFMR